MSKIIDFLLFFKFSRTIIDSLPLIVGYLVAVNFSVTLNNFISFLLIYVPFTFFLYPSFFIMNDIFDLPLDRKHPEKKKRPIASGKVSVKKAAILGLILFSLGLFFACVIDDRLFYFSLLFFLLNILYSAFFKHIVYVDIISQGITPTLRFIMGTYLLAGKIFWVYSLGIFLLIIFIGSFKREHEFLCKRKNARKTLKKYTLNKFYFFNIVCFLGILFIIPFTQGGFRKTFLLFTLLFLVFYVLNKFSPWFRKRAEFVTSHL